MRRDLAANWAAANPILAQGEMGFEIDVEPFPSKVGDGITPWNSLPYLFSSTGFLGTTYTSHTHSQYINTSVSNLFQLTANMTNYLGTSYTSHTHSQYLNTSQSSLFQQSSLMSNYLGTGATASFQYTSQMSDYLQTNYTSHTHSQYVNISQSSLFQQTSQMTDYLGTAYTSHTHSQYLNTSQSSLFQQSSLMSNYLDTSYTSHTHSQYLNTSQSSLFRHTSADSQLRFTSADSQLQFTSAMSNYLGTTYTSHTHSQYINTSQSSVFQLTANMTDYLGTGYTTHTHSQYINTSVSSNFLTSQSNQAVSGANGSFTFQTLSFANSNGISWSTGTQGIFASVRTDYQSSGNYLTTARASNDAIGLNTAGTNVTWTVNSNGISFNGANYAGTGTSATNASITLNSNGLAISVGVGGGGFTLNGSTGALTLNVGSSLSSSVNGSSLTLGLASNITTALQSAGNYLTTAMQSNASTQFVQANAVFNGTNISGTIASGALSLSVGNYLTSQSGQVASASNGSFAFQTLAFSNANNVTFGTSAGSIITASVNPGAAAENNNFNLLGANTAGNTTASGSTIGLSGVNLTLSGTNNSQIVLSAPATSSLSATGQLSISVNGNIISLGVPSKDIRSFFTPYGDNERIAGQVGQGTLNINPNDFPDVTFDRVFFPIVMSNATNSSGSHTLSFWIGLYTRNNSTLSLITSASQSYALTNSGTVGSYSLYSGLRHISIGLSTSLSEGLYYVGVLSRSTSGGANGSYSQMMLSNYNSNFVGHFGSSHNTSMQIRPGLGVYSATLSSIPNSIGISQIRGSDSLAQRPPIMIFANSTI